MQITNKDDPKSPETLRMLGLNPGPAYDPGATAEKNEEYEKTREEMSKQEVWPGVMLFTGSAGGKGKRATGKKGEQRPRNVVQYPIGNAEMKGGVTRFLNLGGWFLVGQDDLIDELRDIKNFPRTQTRTHQLS